MRKKILTSAFFIITYYNASAQSIEIPIVSDFIDLLANLGIGFGGLLVAIGMIGIAFEFFRSTDNEQQQAKAQKIKTLAINILAGGSILASIGAISKFWDNISKIFN